MQYELVIDVIAAVSCIGAIVMAGWGYSKWDVARRERRAEFLFTSIQRKESNMRKLLVLASVITVASAASAGLFDALVRGLAETGGNAIEESVKERGNSQTAEGDGKIKFTAADCSRIEPNGDIEPSTNTVETKTLILPGGATMEMIYVAPGSFMMGSPTSVASRGDDETQHRVTLSQGFWLGKYEVTQRQWRSVMGYNPSEFHFGGDDKPVDSVSWFCCQKFIRKVNEQLNCGARLPTEAEWEYACRAGTTGAYGGTGELDEMGWYDRSYTDGPYSVGQKSSNAWGFFDMHGNVQEWCNDVYAEYSTGSVTDPRGPVGLFNNVKDHVSRGGCWFSDARDCRSAYRSKGEPGQRYCYRGFRLCCSALP